MIGSGLKKLAAEYGMKVNNGVAYGFIQGYPVTLFEGAGYKAIAISSKLTDLAVKQAVMDEISQVNLSREFRVQALNFFPNVIAINFLDNPGTMKKLRAFIDWFFPILARHGVPAQNVCSHCGCELISGKWVLIEGVAHHMHESCAQQVMQQIADENTREKEERSGSYLTGFLGALIGAAIGAVVWAAVLLLGYVASIVGLLIGFLAEKGYNLLKGKQGKGKVFILIVVVILAVLLGTLAADAYTLIGMINDGQLSDFTVSEVPGIIIALFVGDAEYRNATFANMGLGLLFAALGVFGLIRKTGKDVADVKCKYLD